MRPASFGVKRSVDGREALRYAASVQRNTAAHVEIANRARDRPRLSLVIITALCAFGAGLGAAHGLRLALYGGAAAPVEPRVTPRAADAGASSAASALPATSAGADAGQPAVGAAGPDAGCESHAASTLAVEAAAPREEPAALAGPASEPPAEAEPERAPLAPPPARTAARAGRLRHDIIAYTRCDGLKEASGRFPCPRDFALEHEVAAILDRLPACGLVQDQHGLAVIRLELDREGAKPPRSSVPAGSGVDPQAVLRCISAPLSRLRTTLEPDRMIVRFRFELR